MKMENEPAKSDEPLPLDYQSPMTPAENPLHPSLWPSPQETPIALDYSAIPKNLSSRRIALRYVLAGVAVALVTLFGAIVSFLVTKDPQFGTIGGLCALGAGVIFFSRVLPEKQPMAWWKHLIAGVVVAGVALGVFAMMMQSGHTIGYFGNSAAMPAAFICAVLLACGIWITNRLLPPGGFMAVLIIALLFMMLTGCIGFGIICGQ